MNQGQTKFAQTMQFLSHDAFSRCVQDFDGNRYTKRFSCWDQFLAMAFAQLTYRESLRDIEVEEKGGGYSRTCGATQMHARISLPPMCSKAITNGWPKR